MNKLKERILIFYNKIKDKVLKLKIKENIKKSYHWKYFKQAVILFIVSVFFIGVIYGNITSSKSMLIKDIEVALRKNSARKLYKDVDINSSNIKLHKKELEPLVKFFNEDSSRINNLITTLKNGSSLYGLSLKKENGVFGDKYYLAIDLVNLDLKTNFPDSIVYIDDIKNGITDNSGNLLIKNIIPGIYNIKVEKKSKYSTVSKDENIIIAENKKINMPLDAINITLTSNFPNGEVYINDKASGIKVKDFRDIGPFKIDGSNSLKVLADTPWGEIFSNDVKVKDYPEIKIDVDFKNNILISEVENTMNEFYKSVFIALNSENKNDILDCTDNVKEDIYNILKKKYFLLKNNYDIQDLKIKLENSDIIFENNFYKGNIVVKVNYKVSKKLLGIPLKQENFEDSFFTKIKYEEGKWIVYDVENFSLSGADK